MYIFPVFILYSGTFKYSVTVKVNLISVKFHENIKFANKKISNVQ